MPCNIAFFGSSLVSSYWNGAATYYRGIIKALAERGHHITFYEPDALERQQHRDMEDPQWAKVVVYQPTEEAAFATLKRAAQADIVIKASGVGVLDEWLEAAVIKYCPSSTTIFWDVDAPASLARVHANPHDRFRILIPHYDMVLTYGGGEAVVNAYSRLGARFCHPIYNALDPATHFPVKKNSSFSSAALGFLGNRLPDREARVQEFFFKPATLLPEEKFLLGGSGWHDISSRYSNIRSLGHVYTRDHNTFNSNVMAVLNVNRDSMASTGYSPPTRIFEAAGAAACMIVDDWEGLEKFLEPNTEVLVAKNSDDVVRHIQELTPALSERIGSAARKRMLTEHTYQHRAVEFEKVMDIQQPHHAYA